MAEYETQLGFIVRETLEGLEVSDSGYPVCTLANKTLENYRADNGIDINDDLLESDIKEQAEVESFIDYQKEYC